MVVHNLLTRPYVFNDEYIKESKKSKFYIDEKVGWFYPLNNQIWEFYHILKEGNFQIAFWAFFGNIGKLKTQYILKAVKIIDNIYYKNRIKNEPKN